VKNAPAVFALALAARYGDPATKKAAMQALPKVARTSTDMFSFVDQFKNGLGGGTGPVVKAGIANWYLSKKPDSLAHQLVKYRQRDGWTHHDVMHLAHPKAGDDVTNKLFAFAKASDAKAAGTFDVNGLPGIVVGYQEALRTSSASGIVKLIEQYNLPREAIPTEFLNDVKVWEAMLPNMPATALLRNLGKMSSIGLIGPLSEAEKLVVRKLSDTEWLRKSRVHPMSVLVAAYVYNAGRGVKGSLSWTPSQAILRALDSAFYASFGNVEPTGKNHLIAVDVSASMTWADSVSGIQVPGLNARVLSAAMALVVANIEPHTHIMGFSNKLVDINISPSMRLNDVINAINRVPMGSTDCSLPMVHAKEAKIPVDAFVVITDNETFAGRQHPSVALREYRKFMGRDAKSVVLATGHSRTTIADPKDAGMLDIVGFSTDVPTVLTNFVRG
jgi:60 kDa SS-A/Ro ribonucleoprotein